MSVRSLSILAVNRDRGVPPKQAVVRARKGKPTKKGKPPKEETGAPTVLSAGEALVTAIPTEPLAIYTALISAVIPFITAGDGSSHSYLPLRWWLYGSACLFVVLSVVGGYVAIRRAAPGKRKVRKAPVAEFVAALLAFGTWGLVMPESPLRTTLDGTTERVTTTCITFGGAAVLYLFAQWGLTKQAKPDSSN